MTGLVSLLSRSESQSAVNKDTGTHSGEISERAIVVGEEPHRDVWTQRRAHLQGLI